MNVVNETPFLFAPFAGKVIFPKDTLTTIVKGTFRLVPDRKAEAVEHGEQLPPTGDQFYGGDPQFSCRYESDFTYFKPRADVLLVGHCHTPEGQPLPACSVRFQAGGIDKAMMVFGDRRWRRNRIGMRTMSEPEPFVRKELRYENSFGGPTYGPNPVGKGIHPKNETTAPSHNELANLKVLEGEQLKTMQQSTPSGFGPLGRTWSQRMDLVGTYGEKWKRERWPWLPEDFDWRYFNAAPPDQQIKGYLKGDEALYFENLHPRHSRLHTALPGIRVRCFLSEKRSGKKRFREVNTRLDTLWVDMDAEILVLVWRGLATVDSPECDPIEDLLIVREPVKEKPKPLQHYKRLLDRRKTGAADAAGPAKTEPQQIEAAPEAGADTDEDAASTEKAGLNAKLEAALDQAMVQVHRFLDKSDLDPELVNILKTEKDPERFVEKLLGEMDFDPQAAEELKNRSRRQLKEMLEKHRPEVEAVLSRQGRDPSVLDEMDAFLYAAPAADAPPAADTRALAEAARSGKNMAEKDLSGADFSGMDLEGGNFKDAQLAGARFTNARLKGADFSSACLENVDFQGADLCGARLASADLSQARLAGAKLRGADLCGAVMTRAVLHEADAQGAVLNGAQLSNADLSKCILKGADLTQADLTQVLAPHADLKKARLDYAVLDSADLTQADLSDVRATMASFHGSKLSEADFSRASLEECNFSDCRCDHTNFNAAVLAQATFEGATGHLVNFREARLDRLRAGRNARLPGSIFRRACGAGGNWAGADLKGADFILAEMPHNDFSLANLSDSDCRTAELKGAVLDKARLHNAKFNRANLFQARMEEADLTHANFKEANLYGSEFLNAKIDKQTNFRGANLKGTKLANFKT